MSFSIKGRSEKNLQLLSSQISTCQHNSPCDATRFQYCMVFAHFQVPLDYELVIIPIQRIHTQKIPGKYRSIHTDEIWHDYYFIELSAIPAFPSHCCDCKYGHSLWRFDLDSRQQKKFPGCLSRSMKYLHITCVF